MKSQVVITVLVALLLSCHRLHNTVEDTKIVCGREPTALEKFLFIDNDSDSEALLVSPDGSGLVLARTDKGCLIVPAEARGDLYVRDRKSHQLGLTLRVDDLDAGLSLRELERTDPLVQPMLRIQCDPSNIVHDAMPIRIQNSEESKAQLPFAELELTDREQNIVFTKQLALNTAIKEIPLNIKEGGFSLSIRNFDAFTPGSKEPPQRCDIVVDQDKPAVRNVPPATTTDVRPGQAIDLSFTDSSPAQVFVCAKKRETETEPAAACLATDYINTSTYVTPEDGVWDLSYFAVDAAGNQSSPQKQTIAVYHSDVIDQIKLVSKQFNTYMKDLQVFEAFKSYQKLVHLAKRLTLKAELREVYWKLLGNFEVLSQSSLRWRQKITDEGSMKDLELFGSVADNYYLVANPNNKQLDIFEKYQRTSLEMDLETILYLGENRFVLLEQGKRIDVYEGSTRKLSLPFPKEFEFILGADGKASMLALASESRIRLVDLRQEKRDRDFDVSTLEPMVIPFMKQLRISADGREAQLIDGATILQLDLVTGRHEIKTLNDCPFDGLVASPAEAACKRASVQDFLAATSRHQKLEVQEVALPMDPKFPYLAVTTQTDFKGKLYIFDLRDPRIIPLEISVDWLTNIRYHPNMAHLLHAVQGNIFQTWDLSMLIVRQSGAAKSLAFLPEHRARQFPATTKIRGFLPADDNKDIAIITSNDVLEVHANAEAHNNLWSHASVCGFGSCVFDKSSRTRVAYSHRTREIVWFDAETQLERTLTSPVALKSHFIFDKDSVFLIAQDKTLFQWQPRISENLVKIGSLPFLPEKFEVNKRLEAVTFVSRKLNMDGRNPDASFIRKEGLSWIMSREVLKGDSTGALNTSRLMLSRLDGVHSALDFYDLDFKVTKTLPIQYKLAVTPCVKDNVFYYHENSKWNIIHRIDLQTLEFMPDVSYPEEYRYEFCENEGAAVLRKKSNGSGRVHLFNLDLQTGSIQSKSFEPLQLMDAEGRLTDADNETFEISPRKYIFTSEFGGYYIEADSDLKHYMERFEVHPDWFDTQIRKSPMYHSL